MKSLNRETTRIRGPVKNYSRVCNNCNSPYFYNEEFTVVEIENTETERIVIPIDVFECPYCHQVIMYIKLFKNMDITKELAEL